MLAGCWCWLELAMSFREVSQFPEKAPTRASFLLSCAFNKEKTTAVVGAFSGHCKNFAKVRWQLYNTVYPLHRGSPSLLHYNIFGAQWRVCGKLKAVTRIMSPLYWRSAPRLPSAILLIVCHRLFLKNQGFVFLPSFSSKNFAIY